MRKLLLLALLLSLLALPAHMEEDMLFVKQQDLPEGFILGMDVSSVISLEQSGVTFKNFDGQEEDLFAILAENGITHIRVRIWNDPFDSQGQGYGGGNNDLNTAILIGRRAAEHGMQLLVNFHYSDFWADPGKQQAPKAWEGLKIKEKEEAAYAFTKVSLKALREAGADIAMVQLGNETNGRMAGERTWMNIYKIMAAGARAVREVDPGILIAVHFTNPEVAGNMATFASKLDYYNLDYDVFATSYYPFWHGSLDNLKAVLQEVQTTYNKQVLVAETSYPYTLEDTDFHPNTIREGGKYPQSHPFTPQGQANAVADVIAAVNEIGGLGVFYWEGAWITVGDSLEENRAKWEQHGSGWASSHAASYDPGDAGKYYGGSACDNWAFFDTTGRALESLRLFSLIRQGTPAALQVDAIAPVQLVFDLGADITLPDTVQAVMNDGSRREVPVVWEAFDAQAMRTGGVQDYVVFGTAKGQPAACHISMVEFNYLKNGSFEEEDTGMWLAVDHKATEQLFVEEKQSDAKTGSRHFHFYSAARDSVDFSLTQEVQGLPSGTYTFEISIQGGDGGEQDIHSFVQVNGETLAVQPSRITQYNSWDSPVISGIQVQEGDVVTVGIRVSCSGPGAWGKIDDAKLNSQRP